MKTFLNISLCIESDAPLDDLCADMHERLEYLLSEEQCVVFSCTWDREQALAFVRAQQPPVEPSSRPTQQQDVTAVLARFNLTLPKERKGSPPWRLPRGECRGQIEGIPTLRGSLVLTNGIIGFLILDDQLTNGCKKWASVHYDWFVPDRDSEAALPEGLPAPRGRYKNKVFEEFTV